MPYYNEAGEPLTRTEYMRLWRAKNPDKVRANALRAYYRNRDKNLAYKKARYIQNKQEHLEKSRTWRALNPHKTKAASRRGRLKRYGLSAEQFSKMLAAQSGACAGCGDEFGTSLPHIDHDHAAGKVRGLLCRTCNLALGHVKDRAHVLETLANYLRSGGVHGGLV